MIYIAGSFSNKEEKDLLNEMIREVKKKFPNEELYIPMEHIVPGGNDKDENGNYIMPNKIWAKKVFEMDVEALEKCDTVVGLYRGRYSGTGTAWELGYSYAMKKKIYLYVAKNVTMSSLMIINCTNNLFGNLEFEQQ